MDSESASCFVGNAISNPTLGNLDESGIWELPVLLQSIPCCTLSSEPDRNPISLCSFHPSLLEPHSSSAHGTRNSHPPGQGGAQQCYIKNFYQFLVILEQLPVASMA